MREIFFATGLKPASDASNASDVRPPDMTYTPIAKRQLDPGQASRNTLSAPLQCRRVCDMGSKVYLS